VNLKTVCLLVLGLLASSSFIGAPQTLRQNHRGKLQPTTFATCEDVKPEPNKPAVIRGPLTISHDGLYQSYVQVTVELPDVDHKDEYSCRNHSTLFVANSKNGPFESVLDVAGLDGATRGNGFQLIDWSRDSRLLLADLFTWYYGSEGWQHNIVLYSPQTGILKQRSLSAVFTKLRRTNCTFDGEIMGFLPDGNVALREFRNTKDEVEEFTFCGGPTEEYWALDTSTFQVAKINGEQLLKLNGRFEQPK
jgi:hypothetical protein